MSTLPTGTVTFLFTDIEGSTDLAQAYPQALPALLARHHAMMHQAIGAHNGYVFQIIGDSFHVAFPTAPDALQAALEAQQLLQHEAWSPAPIKVRMGINTGAAQAGNDDDRSGGYSGYATLARAARVMSTAYGGQVLLSNASADLVQGELPPGVTLRDMGEHRLKGLTNLERLWQLVAPDLISDFPPLKTAALIPNNLPTQLTSFIGREKEIAEVKQLLDLSGFENPKGLAATRMVTLTGVGGTGKTRLSLQVANELLETFPDGSSLIELAPLADPNLIPQSLAAVFGVRSSDGQSLMTAVLDYLRDKELLLILDNCEHLITACANLCDELLKNCLQIKILASSREALGIAGELAYHVPSLSLPARKPSIEELERCEAARLFVERAKAVNPRFTISTQNAASIAQICQRLDGIPLALELAAARTKLLAVDQIAERLNDRFRLLTGGSRTALPRQQTLRAAIDWSHDLLPEAERVLLRRLSVFVNGWTLEAVEGVCSDANLDVLDLLSHLVDKSLVVVDQESSEAARYRMLETIRQYAADKLVDSGESIEIRNRHLKFFAALTLEAEPHFVAQDMWQWLDRFEIEHDNVRAAFEWALTTEPFQALQIAISLPEFWLKRWALTEGLAWLDEAFTQSAGLPVTEDEAGRKLLSRRGRSLAWWARLTHVQGDHSEEGERKSVAALALAEQANDPWLTAFAHYTLAALLLWGNKIENFGPAIETSERLFRQLGDRHMLAIVLSTRGAYYMLFKHDLTQAQQVLLEVTQLMKESGQASDAMNAAMSLATIDFYSGNFAEARPRFEEALQAFREVGDKHMANVTLSALGTIAAKENNLSKALALHQEVLVNWREMGQRGAVARALESIAFIAIRRAQFPRAVRLLGAAEVLRKNSQAIMPQNEQEEYDRELATLHANLAEAAFTTEWAIGAALNMNQAVETALAGG